MTSQLQVLDAVVNKPFKDRLKQLCSEWLLSGDRIWPQLETIRKPNVTVSGSKWHMGAILKVSTPCIMVIRLFKKHQLDTLNLLFIHLSSSTCFSAVHASSSGTPLFMLIKKHTPLFFIPCLLYVHARHTGFNILKDMSKSTRWTQMKDLKMFS